tara:strand:+ start:541 stop:873 length:333 start_codon:yes stop_codon:yes gene_type:complete
MPESNIPPTMGMFIELVWVPFVALFWWFINRLTKRTDDLESSKASVSSIVRVDAALHDLDKRVDKLGNTTVPRHEYKADISSLHVRANELERIKKDKLEEIIIKKSHNGD